MFLHSFSSSLLYTQLSSRWTWADAPPWMCFFPLQSWEMMDGASPPQSAWFVSKGACICEKFFMLYTSCASFFFPSSVCDVNKKLLTLVLVCEQLLCNCVREQWAQSSSTTAARDPRGKHPLLCDCLPLGEKHRAGFSQEVSPNVVL